MKINVVPATEKEVSEFDDREWHGVDNEHYGHTVHWNVEHFRFMALSDDKILGTVSGKHEGGVLYIDDLMVGSEARGKGVGTPLLDKAEEVGKKYKAHKTHLITGDGWKANDFYSKHGFKKIAKLPNHHFHEDFVIYEREIKY